MNTKKDNQITCIICYEQQTETDFISLPCGCAFCSMCLISWILAKTSELSYQFDQQLPCMTSKCKNLFKIEDISSQLSTDALNTLNDTLFQVYINKTEDIRRCPNMTCNYAGVIDISSSCCDNLECIQCQTKWREKIHFTLQDRIRVFLQDTITLKNELLCLFWKRNYTKKCPNCKVSIEKNEGCENMVCSQCKHGFCWTCFAPAPEHDRKIHNPRTPALLFVLAVIATILLAYTLYQTLGLQTYIDWFCATYWQLGFAIFLDFVCEASVFFGTRKSFGSLALIPLLVASCLINYCIGPNKTLALIGIGEMVGIAFYLGK